jgi:hypothetical protein
MKRKSAKKLREREDVKAKKAETAVKDKTAMPVPELMFKILAIFLSAVLVIALTLYVLGRMPARGFWILAAMLALVAFVILPAMRRKLLPQ